MTWLLMPGIVLQISGMALFAWSMGEQRAARGIVLLALSTIIYTCGAVLIFNAGAPP